MARYPQKCPRLDPKARCKKRAHLIATVKRGYYSTMRNGRDGLVSEVGGYVVSVGGY